MMLMGPMWFFLVLFSFLSSCEGYKFYVGGKDGWVLNPSVDYSQWSGKNRFQVGDSIVFKYKKGSNSVLEVNKEDYEKCKKENPMKKFEDGETEFEIERSGPYYFISGKDDYCEKGQKLSVVVLAVRSPPLPYVPTPPNSPSNSPTKSPTNVPKSPQVPSTTPSPNVPSPSQSTSPIYSPQNSPTKAPSPYLSTPSPISSPTNTPTPTSPKPTSPISQPPQIPTTVTSPSPSYPNSPLISPTTSPYPSPYDNSEPSLSPSSELSPLASTPSSYVPETPSPFSSLSPGGSITTPASSNETAPTPTASAWAAIPTGLWVYSLPILVGATLTILG